MSDQPNILSKIIQRKQQEIAIQQKHTPLQRIIKMAEDAGTPRRFAHTIQAAINTKGIAVIAEIKKTSPSKGLLRDQFAPADIAKIYASHGATCLSVLTDNKFFQGSDDHLKSARIACSLPVIRKDFIIDPYQIYQSRAIGADGILLIVAALDDKQLDDLAQLALGLDMDILVEVHNINELDRALLLNLPLIGINNRDLTTFAVSLDTTLTLLDHIPDHYTVISESGINSASDISMMREHGVYGFLIGELLMRAPDPGRKLASLLTVKK